ncbi:hypothetical protein T11_12025 [Trichinella zimbabwensis]|uniref:Uncharacterized protein n=1 Tax=Trichinella zimbabwensis TaxID=268475 RepID=A0A0V1GMN2_9BILA|nr:hypothetical protein T11_12025 [Trichinella zimbabwensis]
MNVSAPILVARYLFHNYWTVLGETLKNTIIYQYKRLAIKKSPNFENKVFAIFRKISESIAHEISKFSRKAFFSKVAPMHINRFGTI